MRDIIISVTMVQLTEVDRAIVARTVATVLRVHESTISDLIVHGKNVSRQRHRDEVLQPVLLHFLWQCLSLWQFQQDSVHLHTARTPQAFLNQEHIQTSLTSVFVPICLPLSMRGTCWVDVFISEIHNQ